MNETRNLAVKISIISIIINIFLCAFKFLAGIIGSSSVMISDAIHSASDVASTIIVIIGILISHKASDKKHPYGHEKFECLAAIILVFLLFSVGFSLLSSSFESLLNGSYKDLIRPTLLPLIAAIVSIITKELMFIFTKKGANKLNSSALLADAWHHRSDALSSVGALIGLIGISLGFKILEPITIIVISLFIIKASWDILKDAIDRLIDTSCDDETINKIISLIKEEKEIKNIDNLKTRLFGSKIYVDLEIALPENYSLKKSHAIAEKIHLKIENNIQNCKHCMIHVNPYNTK